MNLQVVPILFIKRVPFLRRLPKFKFFFLREMFDVLTEKSFDIFPLCSISIYLILFQNHHVRG